MPAFQTLTYDEWNTLTWAEWAAMLWDRDTPIPPTVTLDCLYTLIRNPTSQAMFYGWLPPHGRTLNAGSIAVIPGQLLPWLKGNMRKLRSVQQSLADGTIQILQTPAPHVWCVDDNIKIVDIQATANYTPIAADPCWRDSAMPSP